MKGMLGSTPRLVLFLLAFGILAGSAACGACGGDEEGGATTDGEGEGEGSGKEGSAKKEAAGVSLAEMVPAKADVSVFVTNWKDMLKALDIVEDKFGQSLPISQGLDDFKRETGMDLRDEKSLNKNGLDAKGSLGMVYLDDNLMMLLPVKDKDDLLKSLEKEAKEDDKISDKIHKEKVDDNTIWIQVKEGAKKPKADNIKFAYTIIDKTALVYPGGGPNTGDGLALLKDLIKLKPNKSLAKNDKYKAIKEKLGGDRLIYAYVNVSALVKAEAKRSPNDAAFLDPIAKRTGWLGAGASIDKKSLNARVFAMGDDKTVKALNKILTSKGDFDDVAGSIGPKPAFVLRTSINQKQLLKELGKIDEGFKKEIDRGLKDVDKNVGVNIEKDILPHLDGNTVFAVYGGKAKDLFDADLETLFQKGHAAASMGIKDGKKLNGTLQELAKKFKAKAEKKDGVWVYTIGEGKRAMLLVVGKSLAVIGAEALGEGKLIKWAKGEGPGKAGIYKKGVAGELLSGKSGTGVAVDVERLMKLAGDKAKGPQAEILKEFKTWSVNIKPEDDGLDVDVEVNFK